LIKLAAADIEATPWFQGVQRMAAKTSKYGFVECAELINGQKYGAALKTFQRAITEFLESKSSPRRSEVALQLLQIGTALEETLKKAYGDSWDSHVPGFSDEEKRAACSFCGNEQRDVRKLIAGPSVYICDECVKLCCGILAEETEQVKAPMLSSNGARVEVTEERLCGICMEARETDELIFLPHAAYMCAGCLEDIQSVRDKKAAR
jgi:hypothetical protein